MHIPDKYRDRYDRLALAHPWMREMRDETETIGDLIEKRIAKNAKREEAVKRLRKGESNNIEWMILGDDCPSWVNYDTLSYNKAVRERIADLLEDGTTELTVYNEASDDELFRCSYCHCKVYNIDMTEGDCGWGFTFCPQCGGEVYESDSRKIEAKLGEPTNGIDGETNGIHVDAPLVAPVEIMRKASGELHAVDYARLTLEATDTSDMFAKLADMVERDYVRAEDYNDLALLRAQAERERDELKRNHCPYFSADKHRCNIHETLIDAIERERDEWKSKAEQAERAMNAAAGKWARADARSAKRAAAVERLKNDIRARFSPDAIVCALLDGRRGKIDWSLECDAILNLLTDDDGAARSNDGVTNLEWLVEHDRDGLVLALSCDNPGRADCSDCAAFKETNSCLFKREWLLAPHEDAHSKAHSKTEPNLSEQSVSLSDANDDSAPDSDVRANDVNANDGNANLGSDLGSASKVGSEVDSREKLEADVRGTLIDIGGAYAVPGVKTVLDWLDRQAAIVECEVGGSLLRQDEQIGELSEKADLLSEERDYWREQVQLCMDAAYPPSHSPERAYDPDVMAYPDRHGCTEPSTLVAAVMDGMRETLGDIARAMVRSAR